MEIKHFSFSFLKKKIPKCPFFKRAIFQNRQFSNFLLVGLIDAKGIDVAQPIWL
jgi:hypothetical protein